MPRVVVLGSSGFDLTIRLARLPKPGETLLGGELHTGPGGKGANAAIAARRAGADVTFLTAFGDDDFGRQVAEHDRREGIDLSFAKTAAGVANQVALIFVGEGGENLIGVAPGARLRISTEDIDALPDSAFPVGAAFLACLEVPAGTVARGLKRAKDGGLVTILNPAPADPAILEGSLLASVHVLTPNQEEARELTGMDTRSKAGALAAAKELQRRGPGAVIVTLGADGCLVVNAVSATHIPSFSVEVVDTVGAGDAFNGALAASLADGKGLIQAARIACAAGALAVTKPGAQGALPTRAEIEALIRESGVE